MEADRAAIISELRRLADELHGGAFGPSISEWDRFATPKPCSANALYKAFGVRSWSTVLAIAGLRNGTRKERVQHTFARRKVENEQLRAVGADEPLPAIPGGRIWCGDEWLLACIQR